MCSRACHPHPKHTQVESRERAQLTAPLNGKHSQKPVLANDIQLSFSKLCLCGRVLSAMD